jgi:hypothetical protein
MSALDRVKARAVATGIARGDYDTAEDAVDALEACVVADLPQMTEANGWTVRDWEDWSNQVAELIPEDEVSNPDADQESIVLDYVRAVVRDAESWGHKTAGWDCQYPECEQTKDDGPLYRVNAKGKQGVFMCARHALIRVSQAEAARDAEEAAWRRWKASDAYTSQSGEDDEEAVARRDFAAGWIAARGEVQS